MSREIGIDIVEFEEIRERLSDRFINRILSDQELEKYKQIKNTDRKILNFIASETKYGFLKYDRFFRDVKIGDVVKVRIQSGSNEGMHQLYTAVKINDENFKGKYAEQMKTNALSMATVMQIKL